MTNNEYNKKLYKINPELKAKIHNNCTEKYCNCKDPYMKDLDIDRVLDLQKQMGIINRLDLDEMVFIEKGKIIKVAPECIRCWELTGLNNVGFFTSGNYKGNCMVEDNDGVLWSCKDQGYRFGK